MALLYSILVLISWILIFINLPRKNKANINIEDEWEIIDTNPTKKDYRVEKDCYIKNEFNFKYRYMINGFTNLWCIEKPMTLSDLIGEHFSDSDCKDFLTKYRELIDYNKNKPVEIIKKDRFMGTKLYEVGDIIISSDKEIMWRD